MKRDMDLVRTLLITSEEDGDTDKLCEEYGQHQVAGHIAILIDAGLVKGAVGGDSGGRPVVGNIIRLTWAGHEFLDNARNDTVWNKVKDMIKEKSMSVSFDIIASLLKSIVISSFEL
jgi:hypothetical protein